tara:strand:- start:1696 stop:2724 length:1029 start_codon:yes stop_codon:yes gene_type:complete
MIFKKIKIHSYETNLNSILSNSQHSYKKRNGYIVRLFLDDYVGFSEVAPLDMFSKENLKEVAWKFEEIKASLKEGVCYDSEELFDLFNLIASDIPSLNFALDIALLDIKSKSKKISLSKYLNSNALEQVHFSDFYFENKKNNSKIVKIKLGKSSLNDDIKYFESVINHLKQDTVFRIDLNQSYTLDKLVFLLNHFKDIKIQYIEEPIKNPNIIDIKRIKNLTSFPLALDETIISKNYDELISSGLIDYAILKAPLFGSIKDIFNFKKYLEKYNTKLVLSSPLQTPVGNMSSIHIAAALELKDLHGLNFFNFFDYKNTLPYDAGDHFVNINHLVGLGVEDEIR